MTDGKIGILVVEDDEDFCFLIRNTLQKEADMRVLGSTGSGREAVLLAEKLKPDLVLMDLNLSLAELDGVDAAREIRLCTDARIVILTAFETPQIVTDACKRAFASGYIFKSQFEMLTETVRKTVEGRTPQECLIRSLILSELSPAERSVFSMMLGQDMHLQSSHKTIANQRTALLKKLGLKSQKELVHLFGDER